MGLKKFRKTRAEDEPYCNVSVVAANMARKAEENRYALPWRREGKEGGEDEDRNNVTL